MISVRTSMFERSMTCLRTRNGRNGRNVMNRILIGLLQTIVRTIVGALNYERLVLLVEDAEKTGMTGEMKRAMVLEEARTIGLAVGNALLNLAIEVAVNALKSKTA